MAKDKKHDEAPSPHGHRDRGLREPASHDEQDEKKKHSHDPEAAQYEAEKTFEPDRDGSS
jgi:hypothetical protein